MPENPAGLGDGWNCVWRGGAVSFVLSARCRQIREEKLETIKVGGRTFCAGCYAKASEQSGGDEEIGQLAYDFLHYEWEHLTKEQQDALVKGAK